MAEIVSEILRIFVKGKLSDCRSGASKMGQNPIQKDKPAHPGLLIHTIITQDRVLRYSESNEFSFTDKPNVVERGAERTINIFAALA